MWLERLLSKEWELFNKILYYFAPVGDLIVRIWVGKVFFMSGLAKIQSWETTVELFKYQYTVPLLPSYWAAVIGTGIELILPVLLVLGLGRRMPAFILFIFNIVAVFSYDFLHTAEGAVGLNQHLYWGMLLMLMMLHGNGKLALDNVISWWAGSKRKPLAER